MSSVNRQILIAHVEAARSTAETVRVDAGVVTKRQHLLVTSVGFVGLFHGRQTCATVKLGTATALFITIMLARTGGEEPC